MKKLVAIDFFCGAGGTTRGFLDAGIDVIAGVDIDASCEATFAANNRDCRFVNEDIQTVDPDSLVRGVSRQDRKNLLLSGCAPCQPFSKLQQKYRRGPRGTLLESFGTMVEYLTPKFIFVENVPGIQRVKGRSTFTRFLSRLERLGYGYDFAVLDAAEYGVPQHRNRLVLVAALGRRIALPPPTHGPRAFRPYRTVKSAIGHYPKIAAGESHPGWVNHRSLSLSPWNLERIKATPADGGDRRAWPRELTLDCHRRLPKGHSDVYGRMWWNRPAPTLTGRCHSLSNGRYGHPEQHRAISLREAAALQTFGDNFEFFGTAGQIAQQIGNAVPVKLATTFGAWFLKMFE